MLLMLALAWPPPPRPTLMPPLTLICELLYSSSFCSLFRVRWQPISAVMRSAFLFNNIKIIFSHTVDLFPRRTYQQTLFYSAFFFVRAHCFSYKNKHSFSLTCIAEPAINDAISNSTPSKKSSPS